MPPICVCLLDQRVRRRFTHCVEDCVEHARRSDFRRCTASSTPLIFRAHSDCGPRCAANGSDATRACMQKNRRVSCNKEAHEVRGAYATSMHRFISNRRIFTELTRSNGQALTRALDPNPRSPANEHTRSTGGSETWRGQIQPLTQQ